MKKACLYLFFLIALKGHGQLVFYQDTYKGGVTSDGHSYYHWDYLQPDTINFQLHIPLGSTIRKAFLISQRLVVNTNNLYAKDSPLTVNFNNNMINIDSSNIIDIYNCSSYFTWDAVKDVTTLVQNTANKLIIPCQSCLLSADTSRHFLYDGIVLVVMYNNNTLPSLNSAIILNNQGLTSTMFHNISGINPINTTNDVGLSLFTNDVTSYMSNYTLTFVLNSSLGTYTLGTLDQYIGGGINSKTLPGSFYYENNSLFGLVDDKNTPFIDSTNALVNIKTYIANNSTTFTLTSVGNVASDCTNSRLAFFLAYNTPCPSIQNIPTQTFSICIGKNIQLNGNANSGTYNWYQPYNSLSNIHIANPIATPTVTTNYIATIDSNGCKHTEHYQVSVYALPKTDSVQTSNAICGDVRGIATIIPPTTGLGAFSYNVGSGYQSSNVFNTLNAGIYTYTVTDSKGCVYISPKTFTITETNPAIATFSFTPNVACVNEPVNFVNTSGGTNLCWWHFLNSDTSATQNPSYVFTDTGNYNITLIAWHNQRQCSDTITHLVQVKECPPDSFNITAPNIFTPNGDDINETWEPIIFNSGFTINNYSLTIFDRWGLKVFESTAIGNTWDGHTTSGAACSEGTYYYIIDCKTTNTKAESKEINLKGFLQLAQ